MTMAPDSGGGTLKWANALKKKASDAGYKREIATDSMTKDDDDTVTVGMKDGKLVKK